MDGKKRSENASVDADICVRTKLLWRIAGNYQNSAPPPPIVKSLSKTFTCFQYRVHFLDCLASLFASGDTSDKNTLDLIHSLYQKLDANPLQMLFQVLQQPFSSVRKSSFKTFYNLVSYQWMLADINNIPGKCFR